jgi:hypothetical protein
MKVKDLVAKVETAIEKGASSVSTHRAIRSIERGARQAVQSIERGAQAVQTTCYPSAAQHHHHQQQQQHASAASEASNPHAVQQPSAPMHRIDETSLCARTFDTCCSLATEQQQSSSTTTTNPSTPQKTNQSTRAPKVEPSRVIIKESYDVQYFSQWMDSLEGKLKATLPVLNEETAFVDACRAVQSSNQAKLAAEKILDQISKQNPVNQEELAVAQEAVATATSALGDAKATCQAVAVTILDQQQGPFYDGMSVLNVGDLITYTILKQAGAKKLADWCQRGSGETDTLLTFLHQNVDLQREFLQAGGAAKGEYGRAVELYYQLLPTTDGNPVLQRLAMAVALELCNPVAHFGLPHTFVDPVQRYVHYEQAFLFGELDPFFEYFSVWELRNAVNSDATDEELGWGRQSLMNYRPGLVYLDDPQWRYCRIVRTDVGYANPDFYKEPRSYDQILSGGGKCGPRAWYGRFACKCFGIPTFGFRQPGHAAVSGLAYPEKHGSDSASIPSLCFHSTFADESMDYKRLGHLSRSRLSGELLGRPRWA